MPIRPSVIVTTYNKPRELELVLAGLAAQKIPPKEILIADDGSKPDTAELISKWTRLCDTPVKHIWQEDDGFRKSKICNEAVRQSGGNYLIFLDGDSVPHPYWVKDHVVAARENTVLCGRRVRLGPAISEQIDLQDVQSGKLKIYAKNLIASAVHGETKRILLGIRLPAMLARCFHPTERRLMGVNFSLHKNLWEKIGGVYEADGKRCREDAELEIQLISAGVKRYPLINRAIVFHLYHPERAPNVELNRSVQTRYAEALAQRALNKNLR